MHVPYYQVGASTLRYAKSTYIKTAYMYFLKFTIALTLYYAAVLFTGYSRVKNTVDAL